MRRFLLLAAPLALLAAACSGGSRQNQPTSPPTLAQPVPRTAQPATPTIAAATAPVAVRTLPPERRATIAPAAASPRAATTVPLGAGATRNAALQKQLEAALLQPADLPDGFSPAGDLDRDLDDPAETAAVAATFTHAAQTGSGPAIQAVYIGLAGFNSVGAAQAELQALPQSFQQNAGGDFQVQAISGAPAIGQDTQAYRVNGQTDNISVAGFAVLWRRGDVAAIVIEVATPPLTGIDSVTALAQMQDARIQNVP